MNEEELRLLELALDNAVAPSMDSFDKWFMVFGSIIVAVIFCLFGFLAWVDAKHDIELTKIKYSCAHEKEMVE